MRESVCISQQCTFVWHANWQHSGHCEILVLRAAAPILHELHRNYEDWHQYAPWEKTKIAQAIKTFVEKDDEMSLSMMQNIMEWKKVVDIVKPVDDEGKYPCLRIVESPSGLTLSAKDAGAQVTAIAI